MPSKTTKRNLKGASAAESGSNTDRRRPFEALSHRDFRLYWIGSLVSLIGSQMTSLANSWQIYQLTHNPLMLGLTGLFGLVPLVLFSLYGGVVADALDRRKLMIVGQSLMLVTSLGLAAATFLGHISVWVIYGMAMVNGAVTAFNNPARSALIPNLVPREHLANALSLGTSGRQLATVLGPSLAGVVVGESGHFFHVNGIGVVYILDVISFAAVIGALAAMRARPKVREGARISVAAAVEGLQFVFRSPLLRSAMLLDFFATFSGQSESLMPIFATEYLHVGPQGLGMLMAAPSLGAVLFATLLATRSRIRRQGATLLGGVVVYGLAWIVFSLTRSFWIAWGALAVTGAADAVSMILRQTISQLVTDDSMRGRMTSVNMIFFMGGPRLGEFESGAVARFLSAPLAALFGGVGVIVVTLLVALTTPELRRYGSGDSVPGE